MTTFYGRIRLILAAWLVLAAIALAAASFTAWRTTIFTTFVAPSPSAAIW